MTGIHALSPLPDAVTKISCGYLDLISLGRLASASSRFRTLVDAPDSDFTKIQMVAKKHKLLDLGFCLNDPNARCLHISNIGFNSRLVRWLDYTSAKHSSHFLPDQLTLTGITYAQRSANRLFTSDRRDFHVRDLQGNVLTTIEDSYPSCYELDSSLGRVQIVLVNKTAKICIWDITRADTPYKVQEHVFEPDYPLAVDPYRFGNLLILIQHIDRTTALLHTFDLFHPENPPLRLLHHKKLPFFCLSARNSNQFFILVDAGTRAIAYKIENNALMPAWEADLEADKVMESNTMLANDSWLLFSSDTTTFDKERTSTTYNLTIFDAKTGQKRGAFALSFLLASITQNHTLHIWGSDILVIKGEKMLHMYQLPDGVPLPTFEPESEFLIQILTGTQELTLLYREKNTRHIRACTWTTPLDEASKASPSAKSATADPSFLENIYSCFAGFLSYFTDLWHWLRKLL